MSAPVSPQTIRLSEADNVIVALSTIDEGQLVTTEGIAARAAIPRGHKMAVMPIAGGDPVRKYNQVIGFAQADIAPGEHVHTHNCMMRDFDRDYAFGSDARPTDVLPAGERATFQGIVRPDGRVATRNYIGVLTTVNCSATVARKIADSFDDDALSGYRNVDGVSAFVHGTGCGMGMQDEGFALLQRTLWGYARHVNIGGKQMYLWRAVDGEGEVFDVMVQRRRNKRAALKLMRKLVRNQTVRPIRIVTAANQAAPRQSLPLSSLKLI